MFRIEEELRKRTLLHGFQILEGWSNHMKKTYLLSESDNRISITLQEVLLKLYDGVYRPVKYDIDDEGKCVGKEFRVAWNFCKIVRMFDDGSAYLFIGFGHDYYCVTNDLNPRVSLKVRVPGPSNSDLTLHKDCDLFYLDNLCLDITNRKAIFTLSLLEQDPEGILIQI